MGMPRVFVLRHGSTEWALNGRHTGRTDIPLLPEGHAQAHALAEQEIGKGRLIDPDDLGMVLSSPRQRCLQTLAAFLGSVCEPEIRDELREWDYGAYEGITSAEIHKTRPGWDVFKHGAPSTPDSPGESPEEVAARADAQIALIRKRQCDNRKDVLVVTHGHFSRVFIARWLGLPVAMGACFEMGTSGLAVLSYTHNSLEEPVLSTLISPPRFYGLGEYQYLRLVQTVIKSGHRKGDRTGTGTLSLFAPPPLTFDLRNGALPLFTTKRVFFRGVAEELLWFIKGSTDSRLLAERGVHIWDGNGSKEFLEKRGLGHRREGDLGPVYGFQWRHFGAKYQDADVDYAGQGVDQLAQVIETIKNNPNDRRILMSAWNPADMDLMALPPCHVMCQFYVSAPPVDGGKPQLSCQMYQRSCDLGLGVPFNVASYSLLTHMIAAVTGCEAHMFTLVMGDAHVYLDHVEPLKTQLARTPGHQPTINFRREVSSIDDFIMDDFELSIATPVNMVLPPRYALQTPAVNPATSSKAPSPSFLKLVRVLFTILVCLTALATSIMACLVMNYYLTHQPMIIQSWSSLIFILMIGFMTCCIYFGYYIFFPSLSIFRRGSFLGNLFMMKVELLFQFSMCAIWISSALAYAADMRGRENCLFDGYYHYERPADFDHLCDLINWVVPLAYATFGVQAAFFGFELLFSIYIFLFIDQDVLDEPFFEWGNRAWNYQHQPPTAISSFNNPMRYRASTTKGATQYESLDRAYVPQGEKAGYTPGNFYPPPPGGWNNTPSVSDESSEKSQTYSRRGAGYSSQSDSLTPTETETSTLNTTYYGGAYAQSTVNSRRAGLAEVPLPAGSGGTSSSAPSWHAPTITSDSSTIRSLATSVPGGSIRHPTSLRHASMPVSLGTRGRRGRAYSVSEVSEDSDEYMSARGRRMPTGRAAAARRSVSGPIDDLESNSYTDIAEDEHWHLRED
ncbi:thymidylate synthase [Malassezia cuniculi]|uniref:thymidylate synthase n=1 Tax=Malassezia cuniculi TaxID=948313 RepID=A0AAF0ESQ7_9BASI|nr:thymidylate synthase [Malassezia cuniculi]